MLEAIKQPWPWYVAGPLIGLIVPALLIAGNRAFGISSNLRHICAACLPAKVPFFQYDWKKESWNLVFALGILIGGAIATFLLANDQPLQLAESTRRDLAILGITDTGGLIPSQLFSASNLLNARGLVFFLIGGFLVGFGTRYAGGCTSGHAIMGISNLQWPSLLATCCFMAGGFFTTHLLFPSLFNWIWS